MSSKDKKGSLKQKKTDKKIQKISAKQRITSQQLEQLKSTFDLFDQDHNGVIDPVQIQKILSDLGLDRRNPVVFQMINDLYEKNRKINFDEFVEIILERLGDTKTRYGLQKLFNLYDTDGSGYVDFDKIKAVAKELGQTMNDDQILQMMHHVHILNQTQNNQRFNFDQFYEVVTKKKY